MFLTGSSGEGSASELTEMVGQIQFLVNVELRSLFPGWLLRASKGALDPCQLDSPFISPLLCISDFTHRKLSAFKGSDG
jgi:hypothetical protein